MALAESRMEKHETRGRKKLHHLEVHPAHNGGHMVMHHYHSSGAYQEPATHVFGPDQGHEMMAHIAKHAKVKMGEAEEKAEPESERKAEETEGEE